MSRGVCLRPDGDRRARRLLRAAVLSAGVVAVAAPARAQADWLVTPFLGSKFGGGTTLPDLEFAAGQATATYGAATALLTPGLFGAEAELAVTPGYFQRGGRNLWTSSYVVDLAGNLILTLPPGATREGLRPYAIGGMGVIHAQAADVFGLLRIRRFVPALSLGGGALGFVTNKAGVRFDLRYLRSVASENEAAPIGRRINYWRFTVGLAFKL